MLPENLQRNSKSQGTSKINKACTSQIIVTVQKNEHCFMKYYKAHYGHGQELQHLRISQASRETIASKLISGVSKDQYVIYIFYNTYPLIKGKNLVGKRTLYPVCDFFALRHNFLPF